MSSKVQELKRLKSCESLKAFKRFTLFRSIRAQKEQVFLVKRKRSRRAKLKLLVDKRHQEEKKSLRAALTTTIELVGENLRASASESWWLAKFQQNNFHVSGIPETPPAANNRNATKSR